MASQAGGSAIYPYFDTIHMVPKDPLRKCPAAPSVRLSAVSVAVDHPIAPGFPVPVFHERGTARDFDDAHEQRLPGRVRQLKFLAGDEKHRLRAALAYGDFRSMQVRAIQGVAHGVQEPPEAGKAARRLGEDRASAPRQRSKIKRQSTSGRFPVPHQAGRVAGRGTEHGHRQLGRVQVQRGLAVLVRDRLFPGSVREQGQNIRSGQGPVHGLLR